jgi:hypothetical protein
MSHMKSVEPTEQAKISSAKAAGKRLRTGVKAGVVAVVSNDLGPENVQMKHISTLSSAP